jgi:hypothetical protein
MNSIALNEARLRDGTAADERVDTEELVSAPSVGSVLRSTVKPSPVPGALPSLDWLLN